MAIAWTFWTRGPVSAEQAKEQKGKLGQGAADVLVHPDPPQVERVSWEGTLVTGGDADGRLVSTGSRQLAKAVIVCPVRIAEDRYPVDATGLEGAHGRLELFQRLALG